MRDFVGFAVANDVQKSTVFPPEVGPVYGLHYEIKYKDAPAV